MSPNLSPAEDRAVAWIAAIQGGAVAYEQLVAAYGPQLLRLAEQRITPDVNASLGASGLVQETLLSMWTAFRDFRGTTEAELLAWMRKILVNRLRREQRRVRAAKRDVRRLQRLAGRDSQSGSVIAAVDPAPTPGSLAAKQELLERVRKAARGLPDDQRLVLLLRHVHDLGYTDISNLLNRSEEAVRMAHSRAVARVKEIVGGTP
jgi:RNA polymerase sigma-70 factor (ECF subfamily)